MQLCQSIARHGSEKKSEKSNEHRCKNGIPIRSKEAFIRKERAVSLQRKPSWFGKQLKATPQNTQKERPCGKIPPGRAYIRHSISAAATLI